jgi:hypothetical protein
MKTFTNFSSGLKHSQKVFIALALARMLLRFITVSQTLGWKFPTQNVI